MKTPKKHETKNSTFDVIKKHSRKITTATAFTILLITSSFAPRLCATAGIKQQTPASTKQVKKEPRPKNKRRIKSLPKKTVVSKSTAIADKTRSTEFSNFDYKKKEDLEAETSQDEFTKREAALADIKTKTPHELHELIDYLETICIDINMGYAIKTIDPLNNSHFNDLVKTLDKLNKKLSTEGISPETVINPLCSFETIKNQIKEYAQKLTEYLTEIPVYERMIMLENLKETIAKNPKLAVNIEDYIDTLANHPNYIDTEERAQQRLDYIVKILQGTIYPDKELIEESIDEEFGITEDQEKHYKDLLDLMGYQEGEIEEVPKPKHFPITETEELIDIEFELDYLIELLLETTGNYQNAINEYQENQSIENQIQLLCEKNTIRIVWLNIFKITSSININLENLGFPMVLCNTQGKITMEYMIKMIDDHHLTDDEKDFLKNNNETCGF